MKNPKNQFYKILSNYFNENTVEVESIEDVKFLETTAILNICLPFFIEGAKKSGVEYNPELNMFVMQIVAQNYKNLSVQNKLIEKLVENKIPHAILKGITVSSYYPEPSLRPLGDIDLLVSSENYEKAIEVITGEPPKDKLSLMHDFHYRLFIDGICVEIHKAIDEFEENEKEAEEFMKRALDELKNSSFEQFKFSALSDEHQAIMLLIHTKRHYFENELNIRILTDWAMYIKNLSDELWNEKIYPMLQRMSLDKWADSLNTLCCEYLRIDLNCKKYHKYNESVTERLADEFISDKLKKKNVDNSDEKDEKSVLNILSVMNETAYRDFKITRKCKLLLPFFWVVIAVRYIYRIKIGFRGKIDFAGFSASYKRKEKLLNEIEGEEKK